MKLLTFDEQGREGWGVLTDGAVIEPTSFDTSLPGSLLDCLVAGPVVLDRVRDIVADVAQRDLPVEPLANVRLKAPVPRPGKILCIGRNYQSHVEETSVLGLPRTEKPSLFTKAPSIVVGPSAPIHIPMTSEQLDYEVELGVVIGKVGFHIHRDDALDYVAGYTIVNDLSIRDIQFDKLNGSNVVGKNFDDGAPVGPWIVTADEIPDPGMLGLRTFVNGELRQNAHTSEMIFTVAELIEFLSQQMTLEPGDLISTGTPAGSAFALQPSPWLKPGDRMRLEIDDIGYLENEVSR